MSRLQLGPGVIDQKFTDQLQRMRKLLAKNRGDLGTALPSAGHYAKKTGSTMYVYIGNSYGHIVYRVSDKPGEYLNPINNTGEAIFSVTPELVVSRHTLSRAEDSALQERSQDRVENAMNEEDDTERIQRDLSTPPFPQVMRGVQPITGKLTSAQARVLAAFDGVELPYVSNAPLYGFRPDPPARDHKILLGLILGGKMRVLLVRGPLPGDHAASRIGAHATYHYRLAAAAPGRIKEEHRTESNMPRGINRDAKDFKKILDEGVILVGGEIVDNNSIDFDDDGFVSVAIMFNVNGYGPHVAAICAGQGDHPDAALQAADEILEEWEREHYPAESEEDEEHRTETFDGRTWELTPQEFAEAIRGTPAVKFLGLEEELAEGPTPDSEDENESEDDEEEYDDENDLEETPRHDARPDRITVYWDETDRNNVGWAYDAFYPNRHMTSGEINGRRDMSDATLTSRARAAVGHPGTRIPVKVER